MTPVYEAGIEDWVINLLQERATPLSLLKSRKLGETGFPMFSAAGLVDAAASVIQKRVA